MLDDLGLFDALGVAGTVMVLTGYALPQLGRLSPNDPRYLLLNLVGAGLIVLSLLDTFNLSAFLMEAAWVLISLFGLWRWWRRRAGN